MTVSVKTCLWYESEAEEAANFHVSLLPGSRITQVSRYGKAGPLAEGTVMAVGFELAGHPFMALNGGAHERFNDAHSMVVNCDTQEEIDHLWSALTADGGREVQCGWLKDRYGLSWQIVPAALPRLMSGDPATANRVMTALLAMVKLDIAALEAAHRGD